MPSKKKQTRAGPAWLEPAWARTANRQRGKKQTRARPRAKTKVAEPILLAPPTEPPEPPQPIFARLLDSLTSDERKQYPITTGFLDYFPDAVAEAARVSFLGNEKHNPGQPLHWSRGKSADHADCILRHLSQRGEYDTIVIAGKSYRVRHSAALLWRAAANLQEELENERGFELPRGASTTT